MQADKTITTAATPFGPWNPGLESTLPREYLPLATIFRPENTTTPVASALELADFTGLKREELSALRPERLVLHEVLIRVMADISVPDGNKYEDLGINFRHITRTIMSKYVAPRMGELTTAFNGMLMDARTLLEAELTASLFPPPRPATPPTPERRGLLGWLTGKTTPPSPTSREPSESVEARDYRLIQDWKTRAASAPDDLTRAILDALARVTSAIYARRGRILGSKDTIEALALTLVGNACGSVRLGRLIEPWFADAVIREGFRRLPAQKEPIVINVKGASASGKSTMRPLQKRLTETLGVRWDEFALISPDIWRKYLLDYDSLGEARRYAGTLTGHEVQIIDKKLDRYMAAKGEKGQMSHLLIDRFRFDSFSQLDPEQEDGSRLLTRFGDLVYMYFMITPPEATVERAWKRGEKFGRYKAVDDLLDHNVEAFNGMPRLFFTWAMRNDKKVHYEFLDNSVPEGTTPRTVAFGWNGDMVILDVKAMIDIERFAKINIAARSPGEVYAGGEAVAPEANTHFLAQCARTLPAIDFADFETGRIYARLEKGALVWTDPEPLARAMSSPDVRAGLTAIAPDIATFTPPPGPARTLPRDTHTLGAWGTRSSLSPPAGRGSELAPDPGTECREAIRG